MSAYVSCHRRKLAPEHGEYTLPGFLGSLLVVNGAPRKCIAMMRTWMGLDQRLGRTILEQFTEAIHQRLRHHRVVLGKAAVDLTPDLVQYKMRRIRSLGDQPDAE